MFTVVQAFEITYTDRPLDLVYSEEIAERMGQADDVTGIMPLVIVRYADGSRDYFPNATVDEVKEHLGMAA